ncbi:MAG: TMEM165/GDT1 family protein [Elainella sp.]
MNQRSPISPRPLVEESSVLVAAETMPLVGAVQASAPQANILQANTTSATDRLESAAAAPDEQASGKSAAFKIFFSTFLTIFLAELGDKTQVTTLLMAAESHAPWTVFAGAGTALVATSLLGVWLGSWLAKQVSPRTLETAAGILLLLVSAQLFWEIAQL